jgi:hypothetical protein
MCRLRLNAAAQTAFFVVFVAVQRVCAATSPFQSFGWREADELIVIQQAHVNH